MENNDNNIEQEITLYTLGKRSYEECSEEAKKRLDPKWSSDYISYDTRKDHDKIN